MRDAAKPFPLSVSPTTLVSYKLPSLSVHGVEPPWVLSLMLSAKSFYLTQTSSNLPPSLQTQALIAPSAINLSNSHGIQTTPSCLQTVLILTVPLGFNVLAHVSVVLSLSSSDSASPPKQVMNSNFIYCNMGTPTT